MAVVQRIDPATYEHLALHEEYRFVELRDGALVEKPPMTFRHVLTIDELAHHLRSQTERREHLVFVENARLRVGDTYVIPDIAVVEIAVARALLEQSPDRLAVYDDPVPLVVEVWSPSTGQYDVATKLPLYRARGDREIWFLQPIARTLTAWCRQDDGTFAEVIHTGGVVASTALPGVRVDLAALFG